MQFFLPALTLLASVAYTADCRKTAYNICSRLGGAWVLGKHLHIHTQHVN